MYGRQIIHPSTSVCNFPFPGNLAEICGGADALSELVFPFRSVSIGPGQPFTFPYNATWNYLGCFLYDCFLLFRSFFDALVLGRDTAYQ